MSISSSTRRVRGLTGLPGSCDDDAMSRTTPSGRLGCAMSSWAR